MNRTYSVTTTKEEYIEFLCYQFGSSKKMRGYRWFITTSIPAVLITGVIFLKIHSWMFITSLIALAAVWIMYGGKAVWKRHMKRKVTNKILPKMDIQDFKEVVYRFTEEGIEYTDKKKKMKIAYGDIITMVPLESQFVIHYQGGAILLPYHVFADEDEMKEFVKEYHICKGKSKK